jgi:hypothetical protein
MPQMETTNLANDLVAQLTGTLKSRDDMRLTHLKQAASLAALERSALEREQKRLVKRYGANSSQASAAAGRLTLLDQESAALAADIARASIPVPAVEAGTFVVYGRIFDAQGKGVSGAKLTATDAKGSALADGRSKDQGMFEVRVPLLSQTKAGKKKEQADKREAEAAAPPEPVGFQLVITGGKLAQPYTSPETITATTGRLAYREITLPDSTLGGEGDQPKAKKKK